MKRFRRNVFRLARRNIGSFLGAAFIIAIGVFIYVAMKDTLLNLQDQLAVYYRDSAMADVFAQVSGISETELKKMEEIPGIEKASGRLAADARLLAAGQKELVTVRLLSYDKEEQEAALNKVNLSAPLTGKDQLFLGRQMAEFYGYGKGEPLKLVLDGRGVDFTFYGLCNSPAYIYSIPPGGTLIPDGSIYDIACIDKARLEELTGRHDSLNELGFSLSPGYSYEAVRYALTEALQSYGLISLVPGSDQLSFHMVTIKMNQLASMGTVLPLMFLSISVFMLYVVLKKMIERDQSLIGTMKALGMRDQELMVPYLLEGVITGLLGGVSGSFLAIPFGRFMFQMFVEYFNLPDTVYHNYLNSRLIGLFVAVGTGILAVFLGVRDLLSIAPAQAMRARAPAASDLPVPSVLVKRLGFLERMGCRSIARHPFRGFLIAVAICFPFSLASVMLSFKGVAHRMFLTQYEKVQVYDLQLSLNRYVNPVRAAQAGEALSGVQEAEAVCLLPAKLKYQNLTEFVQIYGLKRDSDLWKIMDINGVFYKPPGEGLILSSRTAKKLHVKRGDVVEIGYPGLTEQDSLAPVSEIISESIGSGTYMSLDSFNKIFHTGSLANTLLLKTAPGKTDAVKKKMMETSRVTWLADTRNIVNGYQAAMGSSLAMVGMFAVLSAVSGGVLIYNISMINIRERVTELGTLMILGQSMGEIRRMLFFEHLIYFVAGILTGVPGSFAMRIMIEKMLASESYTYHIIVGAGSYGKAFFICFVITLLACMAELHFISRINLTEILKERE